MKLNYIKDAKLVSSLEGEPGIFGDTEGINHKSLIGKRVRIIKSCSSKHIVIKIEESVNDPNTSFCKGAEICLLDLNIKLDKDPDDNY